jgi:hypothetical protein
MQAYVCTILISVMALWLLPELLGLAIDPFELIVKSSYLNGDFPLWIIKLFDNLKLALLLFFEVGESVTLGSLIGLSARQILKHFKIRGRMPHLGMPPAAFLMAWLIVNRYKLPFIIKEDLAQQVFLVCTVCISTVYGYTNVQWDDWVSHTFNKKDDKS